VAHCCCRRKGARFSSINPPRRHYKKKKADLAYAAGRDLFSPHEVENGSLQNTKRRNPVRQVPREDVLRCSSPPKESGFFRLGGKDGPVLPCSCPLRLW